MKMTRVRFLTTINQPDFKAGAQGQERLLLPWWADELIADGYAELIEQDVEVASGEESTSGDA